MLRPLASEESRPRRCWNVASRRTSVPQPLFYETWAAAPIKRPHRFRKGRPARPPSPPPRESRSSNNTRSPVPRDPQTNAMGRCLRTADTCTRRELALRSRGRQIRARVRRCLANRNRGSPAEETAAPRSISRGLRLQDSTRRRPTYALCSVCSRWPSRRGGSFRAPRDPGWDQHLQELSTNIAPGTGVSRVLP